MQTVAFDCIVRLPLHLAGVQGSVPAPLGSPFAKTIFEPVAAPWEGEPLLQLSDDGTVEEGAIAALRSAVRTVRDTLWRGSGWGWVAMGEAAPRSWRNPMLPL